MKKKLLSVLLILSLIFVFGACSSSGSGDYDDYEDEDVVEEEVVDDSEDVSSGDELELVSRGTWDTEDANGYTVQGEIETTGLIRATDWETVESTYNSFDPADPLYGFDALSPDNASQDNSAVLVGTIQLTNTTDGWDFSESSPHECNVVFVAPDLLGENFSSLCVGFGSGIKKYRFGGTGSYFLSNAVMKSNNWRVPFVMVIPNVFTPNEPDGCTNVLNTTLQIGAYVERCEFTMPGLVE